MADQWETAVDKRRQKQVRREVRKKEEEEMKKWVELHGDTEKPGDYAAPRSAKTAPVEMSKHKPNQRPTRLGGDFSYADDDEVGGKNSGGAQKRKKAANSTNKGVANENEMVDLVKEILEGNRYSSMNIAALAARVQDRTGHAWNTRFKNRFGALPEFLKKREDLFTLDKEEVYIKTVFTEVDANRKKAEQLKKDKKAAKLARKNQANSTGSKSGGKGVSGADDLPRTGGGWCVFLLRFLLAIVLLAVAGGLAYMFINDLTPEQFKERAKAQSTLVVQWAKRDGAKASAWVLARAQESKTWVEAQILAFQAKQQAASGK